MKSMSCNDLGGACELKFYGHSFDEIAAEGKKHGSEMFQKGDVLHLEALKKMQELMKTPEEMKAWMEAKRKEFDALEDL